MRESREANADWRRYLLILQRMFAQNDYADAAHRRTVYDKMSDVLQNWRDREVAGLGADEYDYNFRLMRATARIVELDIRAGVDVLSPDYGPEALIDIEKRLADVLEIRRARRSTQTSAVVPSIGAASLTLPAELRGAGRAVIAGLVALGRPEEPSPAIRRLRLWRALLRRAILLVASESRIALLWMVVQPAILIAVIMGIYLIIQTHYILNMDVPSFALLGSTTWIMTRQVMLRTVGAMNNDRSALNIPGVRPFDVAITEALIYLFVYFTALGVLLTAGSYFELTSVTSDPLGLALVFASIWLLIFGIGLIIGAVSIAWPYLPKLVPALQRGLQVFSSVFIVSEQLPEQYKDYILWNPLAHGMQLLRARHFTGYHADDASPLYFASAVIVMVMTGLAAERLVRPRIQPS